jgi:hypothetical protein
MALETVLTRVVAVVGSGSISAVGCPFVALAHISAGLAGCMEPGRLLAPHLCNTQFMHVSVWFQGTDGVLKRFPCLRCSLIRCNGKHHALDIRYSIT